MFGRLIVGPSPYPWVMYEAFVEALTKLGITDAASRVRVFRNSLTIINCDTH